MVDVVFHNSKRTHQTVIERLAQLVHEVRFDQLPVEVVASAEDRILDSIGCALGALNSPVSRAVLEFANEAGGHPQATVFGTNIMTSAAVATLVNGTLLRYLDCNDYIFGRDPAHPSGNIATALAVAEKVGVTGKELIASVVGAYEIHVRLCKYAGNPSLWKRGWHHSTNAQFSNAAVASRLLGNDWCETANAISIAASHQNTLAQLQSGRVSMIKATAEAWVAKAGVESAVLSMYGITGPLDLVEAENGWLDAIAGGVDIGALCAPVNDRYQIIETSIKPYPVVATAGALIAAAIDLHRGGVPPIEEVKCIRVLLPSFALATPSADSGRRYPSDVESAQHSFYFCVAIALLLGRCGKHEFEGSVLLSAPLRAVLDKIELVEDPDLTSLWPGSAGGAVSIRLYDGREMEKRYPIPPGHPDKPLSRDQLAEKYHSFADEVIGRAAASSSLEIIYRIATCDDVRVLMHSLRSVWAK